MFDIINTDINVEWHQGSHEGEYFSDFVTKNNKEYRLFLVKDPNNIKKFMNIVKDGSVPSEDLNNIISKNSYEPIWNIYFGDKNIQNTQDDESLYGITGSGDSVEVFNSVLVRLKSFSDKFNPRFARVMATPTRVSLYDKMVSNLSDVIGYKYFTFLFDKTKKIYLFYR